MYQGQTIFSQLMEFLPRHSFRQWVNRYQGNYRSLIKFYLELESEGYFYLFHEDSRGELVRLVPQGSQSAFVLKYTPVYIPEATNWIELDLNTGKETFHLLVSEVRLDRLERLYNQHVTLNEKSKTTHSTQAVLDEIKALKRPNFEGI
jgi:hypothetical protein